MTTMKIRDMIKKIFALILVGFLIIPTFAQEKVLNDYSTAAKANVEKGDAELENYTPTHRQYYMAHRYYEKALEKDTSIAVKFRYAFTGLKLKDTIEYEKNIQTINDILAQYPNITNDIWYHLGLAYMEKWVISSNPNNYSIRRNALDSAIICFEKQITAATDESLTEKSKRMIEDCNYAKENLLVRKLKKDVTMLKPVCTEFDDFDPQYKVQDTILMFGSLRPETASEIYGLGSTFEYNIQDSSIALTNNYKISLVTSIHPNGTGFLTCFDGNIYEYNSEIKGRTRIESPIKAINTKKFNEINATYSEDGNTIYFAASVPETYYGSSKKEQKSITKSGQEKDYDIYKITRTLKEGRNPEKPKKETWGSIEKLDNTINTAYDEVLFFESNDEEGNKVFYFASAGHESYGGVDLFVVNTDGTTFSQPKNLGYPINTSADELSFVVNKEGSVMYLTSDRIAGAGGRDIYTVLLVGANYDDYPLANYDNSLYEGSDIYNKDNTPDYLLNYMTTNDYPATETSEARAGGVVIIKTVDEDGNIVASSDVNVETYPVDEEHTADTKVSTIKKVTNDKGETLIILPELTYSDLVAQKEGYIQAEDTLMVESNYVELEKVLVLRKLIAGKIIVLKNVFFDYDKYTLRSASLAELEKVLQLMEEYPNMELDVWGHTDIKGSDSYNKTLSMNRAKVVYNWLINQGISKNRLSYDGFGYHKPIATNDTDEGRQLNRRTELHIKKVK